MKLQILTEKLEFLNFFDDVITKLQFTRTRKSFRVKEKVE